MEKAYFLWRAFQDRLLAPAAGLILLGCTLLALLEVVRRYVFGYSFEWQQDAVTFFILSAVYLYFCIPQRHQEHLSVTVLTEVLQALGPRAQSIARGVKLVALMITCAFIAWLVWLGIPEVEDAIKYESRTESLGFPMFPFLAALLLGFAFMAITAFFQVYFEIQRLRGREVPEEGPRPDVMPD
jgi:TRAP-type C4-dicarboxylate transport system permease small subunit